jgi:dephospho-CoA kinase
MFRVGLTGGIGSGKSTVADRLAALGAGVIDTDLLARELTEPDTPTLARIGAEFSGVLLPDGHLDRAALRRQVFADPCARARLESILHPPIRTLMLERAECLTTPYAVLVIPLLFETGQESLMDRVLVVDCPEPIQIERVRRRSQLPEAEIARIIASQIPRAERLARADDVIDNGSGPDDLLPQIEQLHRAYLALAGASSSERAVYANERQ